MSGSIFENLNEKQLEAVQTTEGYLRVIAGAGSGKTKLLVSRYAYLVQEYGIDPANILCVTFTNKAANEMKRRIRAIIGSQYDTSLICTYHGFCVRVLREDVEQIFFPQEFQILDTVQQKEILADIYQKHELKLDRASFEKMLKEIGCYKDRHRDYVAKLCSRERCQIMDTLPEGQPEIVEEYLQKQKEIFALDFDDLMYFTLDMFKRCPAVLQKWQEKLNYIQVDEFQDSSSTEMELIDFLSGCHKNLMIVGDPDQNIYEWRGSDVKLLVDFDQTHVPTKTVFLTRNYRSTPQILTCANTLIDHNKYRLKKDLYTLAPSGIEVVHFHMKSDYEEAEKIAERIREIKQADGANYADFAVLYRSGFLSRVIEKELTEKGIPYEIFGGVKFYQRMEIQDVMAYLRLIAFDGDKAFRRIVNTPRRKFGRIKMQRLETLRKDGESLYETLKANHSDPAFKNSSAAAFVKVIEDCRNYAAEHPLAEVVQKVCADSGYETYIRELGDMERFDNLAEFKRIAIEYEKHCGEDVTLRDFINQISLQMNESDGEKADCVKLMTIHAAKGLEFPNVFVLGLSEGVFPSSKTVEERKELGLEEERRLCYVAITRAKKRLYLLDSEGFTLNGSRKTPSRFLKEIGEENYRRIGVIPKELDDAANAAAAGSLPSPGSAPQKKVGDEVCHPAFGKGRVLSYDGKRNTYTVQFEKAASPRTLAAAFVDHPPKTLPKIEAKEEAPRERREAAIREILEKENTPETYLIPERPAVPPPKEMNDGIKKPEGYEVAEVMRQPTYKNAQPGGQMPPRNAEEERNRELLEQARAKMAESKNLWDDPSVPKSGWVCTGVTDLGAPVGLCEMCCRQIIRYVHHMVHPQYGAMDVGCVCAGKMEGDPERARRREQECKNREARRETFMNRPWKQSRNQNPYLKVKDHLIVLYENRNREARDFGMWKYSIDNVFSPEVFRTKEEAKLAAFEALERL